MAGTIPLSMTQQFDIYGKPLSGGQLYIIQAGTVSTPQDAFQDTGLLIKLPYPMTLDAAGRVPQFFLADGTVKIRLQDRAGVVQLASDSVLVIGPSAGGGGGSTVDPTQLIQTGNMIFRHGVGALAGYVRLNNLTIGSATSGATERANADTQALFLYLWPDTGLAVSGGRGANALADWTANKQLAVPDWRGYALGALDDMGNTAANRFQGWFANPTTLGSAGGIPALSLATGNLPSQTPSGTITNGLISSTFTATPGQGALNTSASGAGNYASGPFSPQAIAGTVTSTQAASVFTGAAFAGQTATPFSVIGPRKLVTFYMKLALPLALLPVLFLCEKLGT